MADQFVAEIRIFPFGFAPTGWALCNGQLMPISQNPALFSLLGTNYGGNGVSNFALPNLQGMTALQQGEGPGLSLRDLGESGGESTVTLTVPELPGHQHTVNASTSAGDQSSPSGAVWSTPGAAKKLKSYNPAAGSSPAMNANAFSAAGGNQPHDNMMPYLTLNFCIALQGIFPPRS